MWSFICTDGFPVPPPTPKKPSAPVIVTESRGACFRLLLEELGQATNTRASAMVELVEQWADPKGEVTFRGTEPGSLGQPRLLPLVLWPTGASPSLTQLSFILLQ